MSPRALPSLALLTGGLLGASLTLTGCPPGKSKAAHATAAQTLVVYCGRGEALMERLFRAFEAEAGVTLDVRYNATPQLVSQLLAEGAESPADVVLAQESGFLSAFAAAGGLAPLPDELLERVAPPFRDVGGRWVGTSGRARVLVYDARAVPADALPRSLAELADPRWRGKVGWAPSNGSLQAHVSALRHLWGEEETRSWLTAMQANAPLAFARNSPIVQAAASGEIAIGWVNHYYLHKLERPGSHVRNYSFPDEDAGNVLMLAGVGVREGSPRAALAQQFVAFLLSERAQTYFAEENFEYPTVPGVPTHADVPPLDSLRLAEIDQAHLSDLEPTLRLLRELRLQ